MLRSNRATLFTHHASEVVHSLDTSAVTRCAGCILSLLRFVLEGWEVVVQKFVI